MSDENIKTSVAGPDLRPVGVIQGPQVFPQHIIDARRLQISRAACLRDLTKEFHFYTPGVIFAKVPMAPDLEASFIEETKIEVVPLSLATDRPIFKGLETPDNDPGWNHVLFALEKDVWSTYCAWLGTVAINYRELNTLWRVRTQEVHIFDPFGGVACASKTPGNSLSITAFVLESQHGTWMFHDTFLPILYFNREVHPQTVQFAEAINRQELNPYREAEET